MKETVLSQKGVKEKGKVEKDALQTHSTRETVATSCLSVLRVALPTRALLDYSSTIEDIMVSLALYIEPFRVSSWEYSGE